MLSEFKMPDHDDSTLEKYQFQWLYTNGLLGLIFTFGLLYTALKSRKARSWRYGTGKRDLSFFFGKKRERLILSWSPFLWQKPLKCLKTLFFFFCFKRMVQKLHSRLWSSSDGCGLDSIVFQYAINTPLWCPEKTL